VIRRELIDLYTPTQAELEVAARASKGESARSNASLRRLTK
jgi:hypothetical protein